MNITPGKLLLEKAKPDPVVQTLPFLIGTASHEQIAPAPIMSQKGESNRRTVQKTAQTRLIYGRQVYKTYTDA